jgi:hypothetical protein
MRQQSPRVCQKCPRKREKEPTQEAFCIPVALECVNRALEYAKRARESVKKAYIRGLLHTCDVHLGDDKVVDTSVTRICQ